MELEPGGFLYKVCPSVMGFGYDWSIEVKLDNGETYRDAGWKRLQILAKLTAVAAIRKVMNGHSLSPATRD